MNELTPADRKSDARKRAARDVERMQRARGRDTYWSAVALLGSVGWPIVIFGVGGALAGRALDGRMGSGLAFTLSLLTLGIVIGVVLAYRTLKESL